MDSCYTVKKSWQGEETPGVIPFKHGQRISVVHRCQNPVTTMDDPVTTTCDYVHGLCKIKSKKYKKI